MLRSIPIKKLLKRQLFVRRSEVAHLVGVFAFCNDEERFAKQLLSLKPNIWLFRTHQQRFCGDFISVDMSSPDISSRNTHVIDLKHGAQLKTNGGGAGVQFKNAHKTILELADTHQIIRRETPLQFLSGDRVAILKHLGCPPPQFSCSASHRC